MRTYDSYKDSGVDWIGEIPSHWEDPPLRYYFSYTKGSIGQKLTKSYIEDNRGEYPVYSGQTDNDGIMGFVNEYEFDYHFPLIFTTTVGAKFMTTRILQGRFSLSQNCLVMVKKKECVPSFVEYFLKIDFQYRKELIPIIIQPSLRMEDLDRVNIVVPPVTEQQQIVSFLDTKTSLIDSLIEETQRKIELLKEKRTSLINEVVTKGLNPNVEMKDSGVEWIGEIPSHWEVKKVIHFGDVTLGKMLTPEDKGGYILKPYLRSQNIQSEIVDVSDVKEMWFSESELDKLKLWKGDLLLNEGGDVGRTCIWDDELEECYIQNSVNRLRFFEDSQKYFLYLSVLYHSVGHYDSIVNRVSIPHLTKEKLESVRFLRPPLSEQNEIVSYLDEHTQLIDKTISIEEKRIELLKEYRQSLISEVVTGKIDVRVN